MLDRTRGASDLERQDDLLSSDDLMPLLQMVGSRQSATLLACTG